MTSAQFRSNPALVKSLREIFEMEAFQLAVEVLNNEGPIKQKQEGDASRILGRAEGYDDYASKLKRLSSYVTRPNIDNPAVTDEPEKKE